MLTISLVRTLIPTNELINHANCHFLLPKVYNNFRWSSIDLHCPANNQN